MMSCCKWKLWFERHDPTLTITSLLVISLILTQNCDVVNAVTIATTASDSRNNSGSMSVKPSLQPGTTISLKAQQLLRMLRQKDLNREEEDRATGGGGYAAEWEYVGSGLAELNTDSPSETQLSPSVSSTSRTAASISSNPSLAPSRRVGAGTWLDPNNGYWYVFGGKGPSTHQPAPINYLSDLWVYIPPLLPKTTATTPTDQEPSHWKLVYRPENDGENPLSVHPSDVEFPLLCGSESNGNLALFKGQNWSSAINPSTESNALFNEDDVVWVSDIPKSFKDFPRKSSAKSGGGSGCNWQKSGTGRKHRSSCNGTEGLQWTSYICCDACLPDGNSTLDFCPQFFQKPILWCNHDSLMAFQLTVRSSSIKAKPKREISSVASGKQLTRTSPSTSTTTFISQTQIPKVSQQRNFSEGKEKPHSVAKMGDTNSAPSHISLDSPERMKNGSNSQGVGHPEKSRGDESNTIVDNEKKGDNSSNMRTSTASGKDAGAMKPQSTNQSGINGPETFLTSRTTASNANSEISSTSTPAIANGVENLLVNWWKFDLKAREWMKMPEVNMSKETSEQLSSGNCRSVGDSHFLYILCPTKPNLLDLSVFLFDPNTSSVHPLGTMHLNNAFHDRKVWTLGRSILHALKSDNQTVIFLAYNKLLDLWVHDHSTNQITPVENVWKGPSLHAFQHTSSFYKLSLVLHPLSSATSKREKKVHSFFMVNPRSKLHSFQDPYPDGYFSVKLIPDRSVFLPARDASTLINSTDFPNKSLDKNVHVAVTKTSLPLVEMLAEEKQKKMSIPEFSPEQGKDLKYDQSIYSQISITNPNTKPFIGESSSQHMEHDEKQSQRQKDKAELGHEWKTTTTGSSGSGGGLPKSGDLSSYVNTTSVVESIREQVPNSIQIGKENATRKTTVSTTLSDEEETHKISQSKSNPGLSTLKNYNKTNNSAVKASGVDVQVISGKENRKILGIKRTIARTTKIDSAHSHPHPLPSITSTRTRDEASDIGENGSGSSGDSANEMRSLASRGSLPVNNESNGKPPLPQAHTTFTFGESHNHVKPNSVVAVEPRVLAVVRTDKQLSKMTSENYDDHPSTLTSTPARRNATKWTGRDGDHQANSSKNKVNLSMLSSSLQTPEASTLKVAAGNGGQDSESLPANLETKTTKPKNSSFWILPKSVNNSSSFPTTVTAQNYNHDHEHDEPNLKNNYVTSRRREKEGRPPPTKNQDDIMTTGLMSHSPGNESFMGDMAGGTGPLTYGSSEILIDSPRDQMQSISGEAAEEYYSSYSSFGSLIFFSLSISIFASFGLFVFVRRCVKCPPRNESDLIKEPPPIRYSVVPDELSFHPHTPLV